MAITVGTSTVTSGAAGASPTLVINSGVQAGHVLYVGVTNRDGTTNPLTVTDNDTGGNAWALVAHQNATTNGSIETWWKRATSGTASKTITISGGTGSTAATVTPYIGVLATGTPHGTPVSEANASGNETQAGIVTGAAGSFVLLFVGCTSNDTLNPTTYTATDPTTLTERAEGVSTTGSDCSMSHASAARANAGATGAISWAQTDGTGASIAFELLAAPDAQNITPTQAVATTAAAAPTVALGALTVTPAEAVSSATATAPAVTFGSIAVTPTEAIATATAVNPTVEQSDLEINVTPTEAVSVATAAAPAVAFGALDVTPTSAAVTASAAAAAPTVTLGALAVSPTPGVAIASATNPTAAGGESETIDISPETGLHRRMRMARYER